jgi:hypothetical protein
MQLSPNFTLAQLIHSDLADARGIDNEPSPALLDNLGRLAAGLEEVRLLLGHALEIFSGYRCAQLNAAVGGSPASQHVLGLAADFCCHEFGTPIEIARAVANSGIEFDQVILEYARWVHISFSAAPRSRMLTIYDAADGYVAGLWDPEGNRLA